MIAPSLIPVSAVVIAYNEEQHIARCLRSLTWADEILVVDSGSTDRTAEICQSPKAPWASKIRFIHRPWEGFRIQRNFAIEQAAHDWLLVVDADEQCTPELAKRIRQLLDVDGGPPLRAYRVHRREYFLGEPIRHGLWNPSYQDRFFHRKGVSYVNDVHEYPLFSEPPGQLEECLLHSPDFGPQKFLDKMNKYTSIEARDRLAIGQRTNLLRLLGAFPTTFVENYVIRKAYRDGMHGLIISVLEGISRTVRHIKMWQLEYEQEKEARRL